MPDYQSIYTVFYHAMESCGSRAALDIVLDHVPEEQLQLVLEHLADAAIGRDPWRDPWDDALDVLDQLEDADRTPDIPAAVALITGARLALVGPL